MSYQIILWDIDGTLLNFLAAEKAALSTCAKNHGMPEFTDEMIERYSSINKRYWEALERGEITKERVLVGRFEEFFSKEGLDVTQATSFNDEYQVRLGDTCIINDEGDEIVKEFMDRGLIQCVVTNGTIVAQERKLDKSGLGKLFDAIFISDKIGYEKPTTGFFDFVFDELAPIMKEKNLGKEDVIIIGDSLTSDILGGNNAGIHTCWYNPNSAINNKGVHIDYEISDLRQLRDIII